MEYTNSKLTRCPLCFAPGIAYLGQPPTEKPKNFFNRCSAKALTGKPGRYNQHRWQVPTAWWHPQVTNTRRCGFPLVHEDGTCITELPLQDYIAATNHEFDVKELTQKILEHSEEHRQICN